MPPSIFISYRRDDAAGDAGRLADHLHRRFGADRVFMDIDTLEPGTDFVRGLQASLEQIAAMLVVIGPRWTALRAPDGTRRLDDPNDFVRLEVGTALGRSIPVVPVLVQGATLPRADDLPASLAPLATRQAVVLDHAEFHDDAERLCDRLARMIDGGESARRSLVRRWWPAVALIVLTTLAFVGYRVVRTMGREPALPTVTDASGTRTEHPSRDGSALGAAALEQTRRVDALMAEASAQRRRHQSIEALATLTRASELAPASKAVRELQEEVAMEWIRTVRVESGKSSFGQAIKPALAVVDASLASATGPHRADLLAHSGFGAFLTWRDGNRQLNPAEWYREALSLDPENPYANAMLAHWVLFREDDVPRAVTLFETARRTGRAIDAVQMLQWSAYGNTRTPEAGAQLVRLADTMRRGGQKLTTTQAQTLWAPYYFATSTYREKERQMLLDALPPDDQISTLGWAFDEYAANDDSRRLTIRYYVALLHARAGRREEAIRLLRTLNQELAKQPGGLRDAVEAALEQLQPGKG